MIALYILSNPIVCPRPNHDLLVQHISVVIKSNNDLSHDNYDSLIVDTACCDLKLNIVILHFLNKNSLECQTVFAHGLNDKFSL